MRNLDGIVSRLRDLDTPVVDRSVVERVFSVKRRQAIEMLHDFGGYQSAQSLLVGRLELIGKLEAMLSSEEVVFERERRKRLDEQLKQSRPHRVRISITPTTLTRVVSSLPEGIRLKPGRLEVDFSSTEQLLSRLFELAKSAENDYDAFRCCAEPAPYRPVEESGFLPDSSL
jgi:hypothetical protein